MYYLPYRISTHKIPRLLHPFVIDPSPTSRPDAHSVPKGLSHSVYQKYIPETTCTDSLARTSRRTHSLNHSQRHEFPQSSHHPDAKTNPVTLMPFQPQDIEPLSSSFLFLHPVVKPCYSLFFANLGRPTKISSRLSTMANVHLLVGKAPRAKTYLRWLYAQFSLQ